MLVEDLRRDFYNVLKATNQRVLVLAHHDVDAVCASQILLTLFRCDEIMHSMVSVRSTVDLRKQFDEFKGKVKYVILLNCGASIDLVESLEPDGDQVLFVADNHRPIDVSNFYSDSQINVLCRLDSDELSEIPPHEDIFREESSSSSEEEEEDEENEGRRKKKRYDDEYLAKQDRRRKWNENRRRLLFDYYEFSFYGSSTSMLFFELAWKMTKDTNELLWLALVGLSEMLMNGKITRASYALDLTHLQPHVLRLNPEIPGDSRKLNSNGLYISVDEDLNLPLYQHWSVWDSLRHSRTVACRFKLWTTGGERGLLGFLAELGFPLVEVKQSYSSMDVTFRKELRPALESKMDKYKLQDLALTTFAAKFGMKHQFSAVDFAFGLQALLDPPYDPAHPHEHNFFEAVGALQKSNLAKIIEGISRAKKQLSAIFSLTRVLLDMQAVTKVGSFLHVIVSEGCADAKNLFCPTWLHALARFVLEANAAAQGTKKARSWPLVLALPDPQSPDHYYVIGIPPLVQDQPRNLFGQAFEQAISRTEITAEQDFFDSGIVRILKTDSNRFLDCLVSLLAA